MRAIARGWCDLAETLVIVRLDDGECWRLGVSPEGVPIHEPAGQEWRALTHQAKCHARERGMVEMSRSEARAYAMI